MANNTNNTEEEWHYLGLLFILIVVLGLTILWGLDKFVLDDSTLFKTTLSNVGSIVMWVIWFILIKIGVLFLIGYGLLWYVIPNALSAYSKWRADQESEQGGTGI